MWELGCSLNPKKNRNPQSEVGNGQGVVPVQMDQPYCAWGSLEGCLLRGSSLA